MTPLHTSYLERDDLVDAEQMHTQHERLEGRRVDSPPGLRTIFVPMLLISSSFGPVTGSALDSVLAARHRRARRHGGDVRCSDAGDIHRDRVRVRRRFLAGGHGAYRLVDGQRLIAIVSSGDVLDVDAPDVERATDHASRDVVVVAPTDRAQTALRLLLYESVEHLPVVLDGGLVGICTRRDLLTMRRTQLGARSARRRPSGPWPDGRRRVPDAPVRRSAARTADR